ncbi:Imm6 family immunity protein [Rhizobium sp. WSM1274]|nr:Imm6 family immunity protein [Rhizobium leguminosarum bv. viciae]
MSMFFDWKIVGGARPTDALAAKIWKIRARPLFPSKRQDLLRKAGGLLFCVDKLCDKPSGGHGDMKLRAELTVLPPREQARRLAAVAASLVAQIERTEPHAPEAEAALAAIRTWGDGAHLMGRYFSDLIYSDDERGTLRRLSEAAGKPSEDGWNALTTATMYIAWLVYQETGEPMPSDVNEVGEDSLDLLDKRLAKLG